MDNKQFPYYIEDWILWIGSKRDNLGNEVDFSYYRVPPVKLANYDVSFVSRSCKAIADDIGFTERQLVTATKIVTKYQRQINAKILVDPMYLSSTDLPPHRLPVREVDRSFSVTKQQGYYKVVFPYNPMLVDAMHELSVCGSGNYKWNAEERHWYVETTELNLALLREFVTTHNNVAWGLDTETKKDFATVGEITENIYNHLPHLELTQDCALEVVNSNSNLDAALENFDFDQDIANAAFSADAYGLQLGPKLTTYIKEQYSSIANAILTSQSDIYKQSKRLDCFMNTDNLKEFMQTVHADYWVFLSFNRADTAGFRPIADDAINNNVSGKKIFYSAIHCAKYKFIDEVKALGSNNVVIFTDNAMQMNRVIPQLMSKSLLRVMYLYVPEKNGIEN